MKMMHSVFIIAYIMTVLIIFAIQWLAGLMSDFLKKLPGVFETKYSERVKVAYIAQSEITDNELRDELQHISKTWFLNGTNCLTLFENKLLLVNIYEEMGRYGEEEEVYEKYEISYEDGSGVTIRKGQYGFVMMTCDKPGVTQAVIATRYVSMLDVRRISIDQIMYVDRRQLIDERLIRAVSHLGETIFVNEQTIKMAQMFDSVFMYLYINTIVGQTRKLKLFKVEPEDCIHYNTMGEKEIVKLCGKVDLGEIFGERSETIINYAGKLKEALLVQKLTVMFHGIPHAISECTCENKNEMYKKRKIEMNFLLTVDSEDQYNYKLYTGLGMAIEINKFSDAVPVESKTLIRRAASIVWQGIKGLIKA